MEVFNCIFEVGRTEVEFDFEGLSVGAAKDYIIRQYPTAKKIKIKEK